MYRYIATEFIVEYMTVESLYSRLCAQLVRRYLGFHIFYYGAEVSTHRLRLALFRLSLLNISC